MAAVWSSGRALVSINEVNLRQARLVLGWVTVSRFNSRCAARDLSRYATGHQVNSVGRRNEYQPMTLCGWGVKAGTLRVWLAGKTV